MTCEATSAQQPLNVTGPTPYSVPFTTNSGGPLAIQFACSGFRASTDGAGLISFNLAIDGSLTLQTSVYTNETLSHKATVPSFVWTDLGVGGTHTLAVSPASQQTQSNGDDRCNAVVLEFPS